MAVHIDGPLGISQCSSQELGDWASKCALDRPDTVVPWIIDRGVAAGGAHTVEFTEAYQREYALNPAPVCLMTARDSAQRVGPLQDKPHG